MEKLSAEQQGHIKKMASEKIKSELVAAGQDPGKVEAMSRAQLLEAMARLVAAPDPEVVVPTPAAVVVQLGVL
jgi:hypothetical protein